MSQRRTTKAVRPLGVADEEVDHEDDDAVHDDVVERAKQVGCPLGVMAECQVAKIVSSIQP